MYCLISYGLGNAVMTGALIDTFEYFFKIYEENKEFKLIFINCTDEVWSYLQNMLEDRYVLDGIEDFEKNVTRLEIKNLIRMKFEKVLLVDFNTIKKLKGLISSKEVVVITEGLTYVSDYFLTKNISNAIYYTEMPFEYGDVNYRMKFLFDRFKPLKNVKEGIYVNSPFNKDKTFISKLNLPNKPIIFKERRHLQNLFEQFDTYVYYHADKWFDPHPRLFHECYFYGKEIMYFNHPGVLDGSYYRYCDLKETGLNDRFLTKDDKVVKLFV